MTQSGSNKKANGLVTASCAAVLAVYAAGYVRTQSAADRFSSQVAERRVAVPDTPVTAPPITEVQPPAPDSSVSTPTPAAISSYPAGHAAVEPSSIASVEPAATAQLPPDAPPAEIAAPALPVAAFPLPEAAPVAVPAADPAALPAALWKDGTYTGWGYSRHGDIEASVVIEAGRIASATISQCRTRYSCSVIGRLPPQVAQRQSPNVDYVSGATQSADAFYGAVVEALNKAK